MQTTNTSEKNRINPSPGRITSALLICCSLFLFISEFYDQKRPLPDRYAGFGLYTSPLNQTLLYDYPLYYQLIERYIRFYAEEEQSTDRSEQSPEEKRLIQQINRTSYWPGIYPLFVKSGLEGVKKGLATDPVFEKIGQGQVWRLFTPVLLHADIFHLFFNMLWLMLLGKQIELRLRSKRYFAFLLIVGIVSNTAQYIVSGSNFIGFSGILTGMLAFIWIRQKQAAWEGYLLDRMTILFMFAYIFGLAGIQLFSFIFETSFHISFSPGIANTAHLAGGFTGYLLGRTGFFSWRHD